MGKEINLLKNYPQTKRDLKTRVENKSEEVRKIAREFGEDFFDGHRDCGYGGFKYMSRFWQPVIPTFQEYFNLNQDSSILDIGCAKGFMLYDMQVLIPKIKIQGLDISKYAIENAKIEVQDNLIVGNAKQLPFEDNFFDVVISINTIHNLDREECAMALREIERVSRGRSFITVDAYRNEIEKEAMNAWNLTAKTIMSVDEWIVFFDEVGYTGDYYWFIP